MFIRFEMLWRLGLFILGIWWCIEVAKRWRDDISLVRDPAIESTRKGVVVGIWVGTAVLLGVMLVVGGGILANWIHAIRHPLG